MLSLERAKLNGFRVLSLEFAGKLKKLAEFKLQELLLLECMIIMYVKQKCIVYISTKMYCIHFLQHAFLNTTTRPLQATASQMVLNHKLEFSADLETPALGPRGFKN